MHLQLHQIVFIFLASDISEQHISFTLARSVSRRSFAWDDVFKDDVFNVLEEM